MLHLAVKWLVQSILQGKSLDMKIELIQGANLVIKLMEAHLGNQKDSELPQGRRRGYMGCVYEISHLISITAEDNSAVDAILTGIEGKCISILRIYSY